MTETEVILIIDRVVNNLAAKFRFGYHDVDDIKQQGRLFAIKVLNDGLYDESRPLDNFLYTHVRNRLIGYKRDNYIRHEPPCYGCPFFDPLLKLSKNKCSEFINKEDCSKLSSWEQRNLVKKNLMHPVDVTIVSEHTYEENNSDIGELEGIIDRELPSELRSDYLRMRNRQSIPKTRRKHVQDAVLEITKKYYHQEGEE